MNVRELRVGNWVNVQYSDGIFPEKVTEIKVSLTRYAISTTKYKDIAKGNSHPIPLTKEWLVKFGFEKDVSLYSLSYFKVLIEQDGSCTFFHKGLVAVDNCLYVHSLQNLYFCLTGTELELCKE